MAPRAWSRSMVTTRSGRGSGGEVGARNHRQVLNPSAGAIVAFAFSLKVLLFPAYRSTDFEVHRNWLATTHSLPLSEWYVDETSQWTLDYPPLFAWFEYLLSRLAVLFDGEMVVLTQLGYASRATVAFQRSSVIATELVLILAAYLHCRRVSRRAFPLLAFLIALNPGLLLVDHVHFQYNGLLLGVLMLSLEALQRDRFVLSAFLFAVLVNMKHLFAVAGPYYLIYMMRTYCRPAAGFSFPRFALLGFTVVAVCGVSLGPFVANGTIGDLASRLFPFGRGLCHAYWAPNFWALYSLADKVLVRVAGLLGLKRGADAGGHLSGGLVGVATFGVLPQVGPSATLAVTLAAMAPCLRRTWVDPDPKRILSDVAFVNLCGFMFGYHVHEKAVLHFVVPMAFAAAASPSAAMEYAATSWPAYVSLLPLLFRPRERALKLTLVLAHCAAAAAVLPRGKRRRSGWSAAYVWALLAVQAYCIAHEILLGSSTYAFLPLLLTSVTCAVGLLALFSRRLVSYAAPTTLK